MCRQMIISDAGFGKQAHRIVNAVQGMFVDGDDDDENQDYFLRARTACGHWTTTPVSSETIAYVQENYKLPESFWNEHPDVIDVKQHPPCAACATIGDFPINGPDGFTRNPWRQIRAWIGPEEKVWIANDRGALVIAVKQHKCGPQQALAPYRCATFHPNSNLGLDRRRAAALAPDLNFVEVGRYAAGRVGV